MMVRGDVVGQAESLRLLSRGLVSVRDLAQGAEVDVAALDATLASLAPGERAEFCRLICRELGALGASFRRYAGAGRRDEAIGAAQQIRALAAAGSAEALSHAAEDFERAARRRTTEAADGLAREISQRIGEVCRFFAALYQDIDRTAAA